MVQGRVFILSALLTLASAPAAFAGPKIGPPEFAQIVHENPDETFYFIVRGNASGLAAAKQIARTPDAIVLLPLIEGMLLDLKASDAEELEVRADIEQIYCVRRELADTYARVIQGLDYAIKTAPTPGVVNMSLGPDASFMPLPTQANDPMNLATNKVAEKGLVPVMALGNYFSPQSPNPGVTNPWCRVEWVICVGAVSRDGKALYENSARGAPDNPSTWPDVVANGINVLSTWPSRLPKSPLQRAQDQASAEWRALPADQQSSYAVMSGTSQATAQVSRAAAQVIFFFKNAAMEAKVEKGGDPVFTIEIPRARFEQVSRRGMRLTGDIAHPSPETVSVTYRFDQPWKIVKQILIDTATPLSNFEAHEVGAGFVEPGYIDAQFGRFQIGKPQILPVKVLP